MHISNISLEASLLELRSAIEQYGEVTLTRIYMTPVRGYAFATYEEPECAQEAIRNLLGDELYGRQLRVYLSEAE